MNAQLILKYVIGAVVLVIGWQVIIKPVLRQVNGFDEVKWRGETFKLKQKYSDYEEYKDGSDQLASNEVEHVKTVMLSISVPKSARSDEKLIRSLKQMRFPGFGSSYNGNVKDEHGNRYILIEYEIPQKQQQRILLYLVEKNGGCVRVINGVSIDHEYDHTLRNNDVKIENRVLKHSFNGKTYREIAFDSSQ